MKTSVPAGPDGTERVATPLARTAVPTDVEPFMNVIVPVGVPVLEVTVAVSVILDPANAAVVGLDDSVVVVAYALTVTVAVPCELA